MSGPGAPVRYSCLSRAAPRCGCCRESGDRAQGGSPAGCAVPGDMGGAARRASGRGCQGALLRPFLGPAVVTCGVGNAGGPTADPTRGFPVIPGKAVLDALLRDRRSLGEFYFSPRVPESPNYQAWFPPWGPVTWRFSASGWRDLNPRPLRPELGTDPAPTCDNTNKRRSGCRSALV